MWPLTFYFCLSLVGHSGSDLAVNCGFFVADLLLTYRHMILALELKWTVILLTERRNIKEGTGV